MEAGAGIAGIRWYEIREPNGTPPTVFQQGTYAPGLTDGIHRWMGSIAMDAAGDMALGYSASDAATTFPSVWYTGRLAGDPLGTLPQGEGAIVHGSGSQTASAARWGDYSSLNVDPVDDCTFWYVNQYLPVTSAAGWRLRVGSFKFPSCVGRALGHAAGTGHRLRKRASSRRRHRLRGPLRRDDRRLGQLFVRAGSGRLTRPRSRPPDTPPGVVPSRLPMAERPFSTPA